MELGLVCFTLLGFEQRTHNVDHLVVETEFYEKHIWISKDNWS